MTFSRDDVGINNLQGRVIDGRYELLERIGAGSMGSVYRAHQRVVDRLVAVKLLHVDEKDDVWRTRFEREAKALGKFDHPGCVRVYDFGWFGELDTPFLVSEFVEGVPLYERLGHSLSPRERVGWVRDIAEAMAHAHSHGVIHRDLKPENVLITLEGRVKVVDFGLARATQDAEIRLTQVGDAHGTPAYMSPEQCRGDDVLTTACDVYALGCMLYELFEQKLPYHSATASGVMIKHVTDPIPKQSNAATPPAVRELIIAMMQKAPQSRPTMSEVALILGDVFASLASDLDEAVEFEAVEGEAVEEPIAAPEEEDPLRVTTWLVGDDELESDLVERRPRVVPAVVGVLLVALLTMGIFFSIRGGDSAEARAPAPVVTPAPRPEPTDEGSMAAARPAPKPVAPSVEAPSEPEPKPAEPTVAPQLEKSSEPEPEPREKREPEPEQQSASKPEQQLEHRPEPRPKPEPEKSRRSVKLRY